LPKKNNKLKKSVSVQPQIQNNLQDNLQTLAQYEEEQRAAKKEKENIEEDDDGWHCVKADKKYLKKGKNEWQSVIIMPWALQAMTYFKEYFLLS